MGRSRRNRLWMVAGTLAVAFSWPCGPAAAELPTQAVETLRALQEKALEGSGAWEVVESLTVEVGPRPAGSAADRAAVAWGREKLEELGFDAVELTPVRVPRWERGKIAARILTPHPRAVVATALGGSVGTPSEGLTAAVIGFDDLESLRAAPEGSLEGKIAYIGDLMERARSGAGYGSAVAKRAAGAVAAARKGAIALLIRSAGTSTARVAHTGGMSYDEGVAKIPAAALSNADADVLEALLSSHDELQFHLWMTARDLGTAESANVIGELRGRERPEEIVLLACHLDSWDEGHGAEDDAAGCGIVMRAAALIAELPARPRRTIRVVLFANEEFGLSGANEYAAAHGDAVDRHVVGMEADFGSGKVWRVDTRVHEASLPSVRPVLELLTPLGVELGDNEGFGGADLSPMRRLGMPIFSPVQDGSRYFDVHHTPDDTLARVDREGLDQNVAVYATLAWAAAELDLGLAALDPEAE